MSGTKKQTLLDTVKGEYAPIMGEKPASAGEFIGRYLQKNKLSANQAAKQAGCSASTITRLINGGDLTVAMAVKISMTFGLQVDALFAMDAQQKTYLAMKDINERKRTAV